MDSFIVFCSSPDGFFEGLFEGYTVGFATHDKREKTEDIPLEFLNIYSSLYNIHTDE